MTSRVSAFCLLAALALALLPVGASAHTERGGTNGTAADPDGCAATTKHLLVIDADTVQAEVWVDVDEGDTCEVSVFVAKFSGGFVDIIPGTERLFELTGPKTNHVIRSNRAHCTPTEASHDKLASAFTLFEIPPPNANSFAGAWTSLHLEDCLGTGGAVPHGERVFADVPVWCKRCV
jgi:hypothetical protein